MMAWDPAHKLSLPKSECPAGREEGVTREERKKWDKIAGGISLAKNGGIDLTVVILSQACAVHIFQTEPMKKKDVPSTAFRFPIFGSHPITWENARGRMIYRRRFPNISTSAQEGKERKVHDAKSREKGGDIPLIRTLPSPPILGAAPLVPSLCTRLRCTMRTTTERGGEGGGKVMTGWRSHASDILRRGKRTRAGE